MDRFAWDIGQQNIDYPEIGETITVASMMRDYGEKSLRSLSVYNNSVSFDIDWDDQHTFPAWEWEPEKYEGNYLKDGWICSDEWWLWKVERDELGNLTLDEDGTIEEWALGRTQSLTINRLGELIWKCTTLLALEDDETYPPVIKTTWMCKAGRVDY